MKIILLETVYKHGVAGEVVDVANGFARNYLIPKGLATKATPTALKKYRKIREVSEAKRQEYEGMLNELGRRIDGTALVFFRRAANSGKLFGSVTTQDIAEALDEATGVDINRRRISQQGLRDIGLHEVPVRLGTDISPVLQIRVLRESERVEYNRQLEAIENGLLDQMTFDDEGMLVSVDLDQLRSRKERQAAAAEAAAEMEAAREVIDEDDVEVPAAADAYEAYDEYADAPPASDEDEYADDSDT